MCIVHQEAILCDLDARVNVTGADYAPQSKQNKKRSWNVWNMHCIDWLQESQGYTKKTIGEFQAV